MRGLVDCLVFDGCEAAEASLLSSAVVGALDPGDDGQPQLLAGGPALAVQDVLLQQAKKDSMAALSPQAPTRPMDPVRPWMRSART